MNVKMNNIGKEMKDFFKFDYSEWHKRELGCEARNRDDFMSLKKFIDKRGSKDSHCHEKK
jgi:hypothetical protein